LDVAINEPMKQLRPGIRVDGRNRVKAALMVLVMFYPLVVISPLAAEKPSGPTWSRTYAPIVGGDSLGETSDGGFVIAANSFGAWVMKSDNAGTPEWERNYMPTGYLDAYASQVQQTSDGGYLVTGYASFGGPWLLKLDNNGNVQWSRIYNGEGFSWVGQTSDGG